MKDLADIDFLCVFGISCEIYAKILPWLDQHAQRRLVFVCRADALELLRKEVDAILLFSDLRVKIHVFETFFQMNFLAKQIGWEAVFLKMKVIEAVPSSEHFEAFKTCLENDHLGADLLLSDAADCGLRVFQNISSRTCRPFRSALDLRGAFSKIPAVIVGAGPSLEKNRGLLKEISKKALIFSGGAALNLLDFAPHFAGAIDSQAPYNEFKRFSFPKVPFCFQSRMSAENFSVVQGETLLAPDNHYAFVNWLDGQESFFNGGWTVGNFLTALAFLWGCDPIIFVGMDFCYDQGRKYTDGGDLGVETLCFVNGVWTQRDWLMARQWTEQLALNASGTTFINATEGGMGLMPPIQTKKLAEVNLGLPKELVSLIHEKIQSIPYLPQVNERWKIWKKSLKNCAHICKKRLSSLDPLKETFFLEEEIVYQKFLSPLWDLWHPIFAREFDLEPQEIREQKLRLHQCIFFERVVQEQLNVLR